MFSLHSVDEGQNGMQIAVEEACSDVVLTISAQTQHFLLLESIERNAASWGIVCQ